MSLKLGAQIANPVPSQHQNEANSKQSGLIPLEDWLNSNSEPEKLPAQQPKKAKKEPQPRSITPLSLDPNDKTNWVGKLHQYWDNLPEPGTITEEVLDFPPPHLFTCTVTTSASPKPFGGASYPFLRKKDAKQNAAKLAVEYLIQTGHISQEKLSNEPKKSISPVTKNPKLSIPIEDLTIPAQVNHLAHMLGIKSPTYVIGLEPDSVALYSGYAYFPGEPLIEGKVGEFRNVWAKKAAKEECARDVLKFLQGIEKHREEMLRGDGSVGGKRKRVDLDSPERLSGETANELKYDESGDDEESTYGTPKSGF